MIYLEFNKINFNSAFILLIGTSSYGFGEQLSGCFHIICCAMEEVQLYWIHSSSSHKTTEKEMKFFNSDGIISHRCSRQLRKRCFRRPGFGSDSRCSMTMQNYLFTNDWMAWLVRMNARDFYVQLNRRKNTLIENDFPIVREASGKWHPFDS